MQSVSTPTGGNSLAETLSDTRQDLSATQVATQIQEHCTRLPLLEQHAGEEFELSEELGRGAMGRVHAATEKALHRSVAIKTLSDKATPFAIQGLLTEGQILGQLEHPSIVPVHRMGLDPRGLPALVMKRISGVAWSTLLADPSHPTLRHFIQDGTDPLEAHIELLLHVCDAVRFAHEQQVVHLDIKPENVMVGAHGEVYLVDWGLARFITPQANNTKRSIIGTPFYMAPELARGLPVDARTDVFLLGATLHFVLTGTPRNAGTTFDEVLANAAKPTSVSYDSEVPEELANLANRATAEYPNDRPATVELFRRGLLAWKQHRASHRLAQEATVRLARLEGLYAAGIADPTMFLQLGTECRFGFSQALREWPENSQAKEGLQSCLRVLLRWTVAHEDATSAQALLRELTVDDPALVAMVKELEERLAERKHRAEQAQHIVRDRDLRVGGHDRLRLLVLVVASLSVVRLGLIAARGPAVASEPRTLLGVACFAFLLLSAGVAAGRRSLLSNLVSKQIVGMLLLMLAGITVNRALGVVHHTPGEALMATDSLIAALTGALSALSIHRLLAWSAFLNLSGLVCSTVWPLYTAYVFTVSSLAGLLVVASVVGDLKRKQAL